MGRAGGRGWRLALLLMLLLGCPRLALAEEPAPAVLAFHGGSQPEVIHALVAIAAGDAATVAQLPRALFHAEVAVPDPVTSDLAWRWSQCIPRALARTPPALRAAVLQVLDSDCRADLAAHPREPWLAIDYLPAPSAQDMLATLSATAFDHGAFNESLCASALLSPDPLRRARDVVARALGGEDAVVDASLALEAPGEPQPCPGIIPAHRSGEQVVWQSVPGWLLACTPARQVLWQFRLDLGAEVLTGAGATLVHDSLGLREVAEDGVVTALTPPPGNTRLLAIGGGASWYATGSRAWRLMLGTNRAGAIDLGEAPVCAPLVRGPRSLWLLPQELVLCQDLQVIARVHHHLAVDADWRLCSSARLGQPQAQVIAPDGGSWCVPSLAQQLAALDAVARARLLVMAERPLEALGVLDGAGASPWSGEARDIAYRAHLALGPAHVASHAREILALTTLPQQQACVLYARFQLCAPGAEAAGASAALLACLRSQPGMLVSWSVSDLALDPGRWAHVSSAQVLAAALERWQSRRTTWSSADPTHPLLPGERVIMPPPREEAVLDPQLGRVHRYGDALVLLEHASGQTTLSCHDQQSHQLRWRTRWASDPLVPSRSLSIRDGCCVVSEGSSRLLVVDVQDGQLLMIIDGEGMTVETGHIRVISEHCLMMTSTWDDELLVAQAPAPQAFAQDPAEIDGVRLALPRRARFLAPLPLLGQGLVVFTDGSAARYGAGVEGAPTVLPATLSAASEAPLLTSQGLVSGALLYRWRE